MISNKKGFLLAEESLKLIIGVIAVSLLVYFLFSIYNTNKDSKELELAEESLDYIIEGIDAGLSEIEIYNPKGWFVSSWPQGNNMPLSCSVQGMQDCICICKNMVFKSRIEECDKKSVCRESEYKLGQNIEIKNPPVILEIDYQNKQIIKK